MPDKSSLLVNKFPIFVEFVSVAKGNLSTLDPTRYPSVVEFTPPPSSLPIVKSPTSVAFATVAKGNLSIIFCGPGCPPRVYP